MKNTNSIKNLDSSSETKFSEENKNSKGDTIMDNNKEKDNTNTLDLGGIMKNLGIGFLGGAAAYFIVKKISGGDEKTVNEIQSSIEKILE